MPFHLTRLASITLLCFAASSPCLAESVASSASSAGSASVGSLSDSFQRSSNSSSRNNEATAGDYKVVNVAAVAERPGMLRLTLQAMPPRSADDDAYWLDLPERALAARGLAPGDVVSAVSRPYGLEFAHADTRQAFFLALADDWHRDLEPRVVTQ